MQRMKLLANVIELSSEKGDIGITECCHVGIHYWNPKWKYNWICLAMGSWRSYA